MKVLNQFRHNSSPVMNSLIFIILLQVKCVRNCDASDEKSDNCVTPGAEMSFKKPDGWKNIKCSSVLYPDFREPNCHCLGDYDANNNFALTA